MEEMFEPLLSSRWARRINRYGLPDDAGMHASVSGRSLAHGRREKTTSSCRARQSVLSSTIGPVCGSVNAERVESPNGAHKPPRKDQVDCFQEPWDGSRLLFPVGHAALHGD